MTLSDLTQRLRWLLSDPDGELFSDAVLVENVRLALAEIQQICPLVLRVAGLDGAESTVLDSMEHLLLRRARCLLLQQRMQARSEGYHPDPPQKYGWEPGLAAEQQAIDQDLDRRRVFYLQRAAVLPYAVWPDEVNQTDD